MSKKLWFGLVFLICCLLVALWKFWAWILWKLFSLRKEQQVFNLLGKHRFIEITGPSGKGKSWLLCHLFKNLKAVKFTNLPTPQSTYTLSRESLETHLQGKWAAPHRFYYFLDDLTTFQKWAKTNLGLHGYKSFKDYTVQAGKLGATFIWTNNGLEPDWPFRQTKNTTWKVVGYLSFMDYSLLILWKTYWFTLIPISNKELEGFYDPHWNMPTDYQANWLKYIAERLKGSELKEILHMVETGGNSDQQWLQDKKFNRNLLTEYIRLRKVEEAIARKKREKAKGLKHNLKRYGLKTSPITPEELNQWDQEEKRQKSEQNPTNLKKDLNQATPEATGEFASENEGAMPPPKNHSKKK